MVPQHDSADSPTRPHLSSLVHSPASLLQHLFNPFMSHLPVLTLFLPPLPAFLYVCFTLLCRSFPLSSPCFDMAGSWNTLPHNLHHQKFIEPGKETRRRRTIFFYPTFAPSLSLCRLVFIPYHSFPLLHPPPFFNTAFISLSPSLSLWQFSPTVAGMQLLSSLTSPLPLWCLPLLLSLFDTVNKQVGVAVIVDASAQAAGNE